MLHSRPLGACFIAVFSLILAIAPGLPGHAQTAPGTAPRPPDVFSVGGIAVDASADSAAAARPLALADGQRRAFVRLMRRLTLVDDPSRLPRPGEALLNDIVAGFGIDEERTSATRYIGRISVQFRPDAVRRLLQDAKLPYSETASRPVLVVPVWQGQAALKLWEADNPWRQAWQFRPDGDGLVPLPVAGADPAGQPLERLLASADELRMLARRAGADDIIVAAATQRLAEPGNHRIDIAVQHAGSAAFLNALEPFVATGGTQEEALLSAAIELTRRVETLWKRASAIDLEQQGQISVAAGYGGLADWNRLRGVLATMPTVRRVEVLRMSHRDAQLLVDFFGSAEQLGMALAQRDVVLRQSDGFWDLQVRRP